MCIITLEVLNIALSISKIVSGIGKSALCRGQCSIFLGKLNLKSLTLLHSGILLRI